jgi:transposase, IS30 family
LLKKKYSCREIAHALSRSISTISNEIHENSVKGKYDPVKAQHKAYTKRHDASFRGKKIVGNRKLRKFIEQNLLDGQSPEAISGRIKHHKKELPNVSKNTVYRFLRSPYGKVIGLKLKKKKYRKKRPKVTKLEDRVFIDTRPQIIEKRGRVGDVEIDFIVSGRGGKGILMVAVDRKLRVVFLELILKVTVDNVHAACERIKKRFPELKSVTLDNDILFQMHQVLQRLLGVPIYFCHPYHSWEKGSVENRNKIIRQFITKGSDLSQYKKDEIKTVEEYLNDRYLKCLKYATPREKLRQYRTRKKKIKKTASDAEKIINR